MTALREEMFWMCLLKITASNLIARNLRSDGEHWNPAAVAIVQAVDQMQIAGPAAAGAHRQPSREMRFRTRRKRGRLFVPCVNPLNLLLSSN
jgi:hypothetical protein